MSSGVLTICIVVFPPPHLIIAHKDRDDEVQTKPVAIEMKRKKGGVTSENQKWIKTLNEAGTVACKGCDAAIEFIKSIT